MFGSFSGFNILFGISNSFVGTSAGFDNSTGSSNSFFGRGAGAGNTTGDNNTVIGDSANVGSGGLTFATAIGAGALVWTSNTVVLGTTSDTVVAPNLLRVNSLGAAGSTSLCRNALNQISTCTAGNFTNSGDGKNNEQLNVLQRQNLQMLEELKAQQEENGAQAEQIKQQRTQLQTQQKLMDGLQKIVCTQNPRAEVCKEQK